MQKLFKGSKIVGSAFPIVIVPMGAKVQEISSFETSLGAQAVPSSLRRLSSMVRLSAQLIIPAGADEKRLA